VTPPEFAGLRPPGRTGQVGGVRCELVLAEGKTRLGACYQQVPLRVLPPFQLPPDPGLLYLLNPTAGLLDGDAHLIELAAGPGTRAVVTGQSANRVHPAVDGFATQRWRVRVAAGARLVVLPGPTIPFAGCRYHQRTDVELEEGAQLLWGDVWLPGRYCRGAASEWFRFDRVVQHLEVRRGGRLAYRERFDWRGPWSPEEADWLLGGARATASLFVTGPACPPPDPGGPGVERTVLRLASGDTCVRWCGPPQLVPAALVGTALRLAGDHDRPWLLGSRNLTEGHWFSVRLGRQDARREA